MEIPGQCGLRRRNAEGSGTRIDEDPFFDRKGALAGGEGGGGVVRGIGREEQERSRWRERSREGKKEPG